MKLSSVLCFSLLVSLAAAVATQSQVQMWADALSQEFRSLGDGAACVGPYQTQLGSIQSSLQSLDAAGLLSEVGPDLQRRFTLAMDSAKSLRDTVQLLSNGGSGTNLARNPECCTVSAAGLEFNPTFQGPVDLEGTCFRLPAGVSLAQPEVAAVDAWSRPFGSAAKAETSKAPITFSYFGSVDGFFRLYPSGPSSSCDSYDARSRPWFSQVQTRTHNLVLVIDSSGSMQGTRMASAKEAAKAVLDSLAPDNYVTVVDFDSSARRPSDPACAANKMLRASKENIEKLKIFVDSMVASGGTQYSKALSEAYTLLKSGTYADRSVVIFLSDGAPGDAGGESAIRSVISSEQPPSTVLLTYGLQISSSARTILSNMASDGGGEYTDILTEANLRSSLSSYYSQPSLRHASTSRCQFTAPYYDAFGLGVVFTAACTAYHPATNELLGVVGVDVVISELTESIGVVSGEAQVLISDANGDAFLHPLIPEPQDATEDPALIPISLLEDSDVFRTTVFPSMMRGDSASATGELMSIVARGDTNEGGETATLSVEYAWQPLMVNGETYSVCVRVERGTMGRVVLVPSQGTSVYHRVDLDPQGQRILTVDPVRGVLTAPDVPGFKLSPTSYEATRLYRDGIESPSDAARMAAWAAAAAAPLGGVLFDGSSVHQELQATALLDACMLSVSSDNLDTYAFWRYLGTMRHGIMRNYPASAFTNAYDPRQRPWMLRAIANQGKWSMAAPYVDAITSQRVTTLSHTVVYPGTDDVFGVIGIDFTVARLRTIVDLRVPCPSGSWCFLFDSSGYLITAPDKRDSSLGSDWLGEFRGSAGGAAAQRLAREMLERGYMSKRACHYWETLNDQTFYEVTVNGTVSSADPAFPFVISEVPDTNMYLATVPSDYAAAYNAECAEVAGAGNCRPDEPLTCQSPCLANTPFTDICTGITAPTRVATACPKPIAPLPPLKLTGPPTVAPAPTVTPAPTSSPGVDQSLPVGALVGIIVGGVVGLAALITCICCIARRSRTSYGSTGYAGNAALTEMASAPPAPAPSAPPMM